MDDGYVDWRHGLFRCHETPRRCLSACLCGPCWDDAIVIARVSETPFSEAWLLRILEAIAIGPFGFCTLVTARGDLRARLRIRGSVARDVAAVACCRPLAVLQMRRELDTFGAMLGPPAIDMHALGSGR